MRHSQHIPAFGMVACPPHLFHSSFLPMGSTQPGPPPSPAGRFYCVSHHFARISLFPPSPLIPEAHPIIADSAPLTKGKSLNPGRCKGHLLILMEFFAGEVAAASNLSDPRLGTALTPWVGFGDQMRLFSPQRLTGGGKK